MIKLGFTFLNIYFLTKTCIKHDICYIIFNFFLFYQNFINVSFTFNNVMVLHMFMNVVSCITHLEKFKTKLPTRGQDWSDDTTSFLLKCFEFFLVIARSYFKQVHQYISKRINEISHPSQKLSVNYKNYREKNHCKHIFTRVLV